jgi:PBP1b-binding outer membrane lipoprotein LpoB
MKKLTVLSLILLLAVGLFVTGCKKKKETSESKKTEVKAPVEKATEAPT